MGHDTYAKAKVIDKEADEETKAKLRRNETTINAVYNYMRKPHVSQNSGNNEWYTHCCRSCA